MDPGKKVALLALFAWTAAAAPAAAHVVVTSDFRNPVPLGAVDRYASVTVLNEDPIPEEGEPEPPPYTVCNSGECGSQGITLVPSCGVQAPGGQCTTIDPGVFAVSSTGTGALSGCPGVPFTITEISPGKLRLSPATPGHHIVLPPQFRCRIDFTLDVLKAPAIDSHPDLAGLQTTQVTEVVSTENLQNGVPIPEVGTDFVEFFDPTPTPIPPSTPPRPRTPVVPGRPAIDTTPPALTDLTLSRSRFRSAGSRRVRTEVRYRLSEAAEVTFRVERARSGRRSGGRCVRLTRGNRGARRCRRYVRLRGSFTQAGRAGANALRFRGRLRGRSLSPGRYRLRAVASDSAGNLSAPTRRAFRIVPR